jgi:hypothetical protein
MLFNLKAGERASVADYNAREWRVAILADHSLGFGNARLAAERMGARILFEGPVAEGATRLSDAVADDAVLVSIEQDAGPSLDRALERINIHAHTANIPVIVNASLPMLDHVAAVLDAPSVALMSEAAPTDWIAALALAGTDRAPMLREVSIDETLRLQRLSDEVSRIAQALSDLAGVTPTPMPGFNAEMIGYRAPPMKPLASAQNAADTVRKMIRLRRLRDRHFPGDLFADPAWDMLLDLMAARLEGLRVAVSSLCIAAAVPPTTALRWIKTMTDHGLFIRDADVMDGRRVFIELSDQAASAMDAWLSAAKSSGGLAA